MLSTLRPGSRHVAHDSVVIMFRWLEYTPLAQWVKESWGWPFALTLHALGSAIMVGLTLIACLRLLGMFSAMPVLSFIRLMPLIWVCLGLQVFSGILLWLTKPGRYLSSDTFDLKLVLLVVGSLTMAYVQRTVSRGHDRRAALDTNVAPRPIRLAVVGASMAWITGVTILPRYVWSCPYAPPCGYYPPGFWTTIVIVAFVLAVVIALVARLDRHPGS
jgi:hypothetical protein